MFKIKKGVVLVLTNDNTAKILYAAIKIFDALGVDCVVTSGLEGVHGDNSKHYELSAIDFRGRELDQKDFEFAIHNFKEMLGPDYDVVPSNAKAIHIEYDPKGV